MDSKVTCGSSDKTDWFKNHSLTEEQRKKLIDEKLERVHNQKEFDRKAREIFSYMI